MGNCFKSRNRDALDEDTHQEDLTTTARMFFAEMVGTFILMFSVCGIIASTVLMKGGVGLMEYAATGGLSIVVIIFAIGPISGANVNPAVTIASAMLGHMPWTRVPFYVLAQVLGSVLATFVGKSVYGIQAELMITQPSREWSAAFWAEFIATLIVMFLVVMMCRLEGAEGVDHMAGFVVGIAIALAILITGLCSSYVQFIDYRLQCCIYVSKGRTYHSALIYRPVSGGSLNPARSFGPALVSWRFNNVWLYLIAPTTGAVVGAFLARLLCRWNIRGSLSCLTTTSLT